MMEPFLPLGVQKPSDLAHGANKCGRIWISYLYVWILMLFLSGCSFNRFGLVETEEVEGHGAFILHTKAPGVHLHNSTQHSSLTVGFFEYLSIFSVGCQNSTSPQNAYSVAELQASVLRVYGFHVGRPAGITIGYQEHAHLLQLDRFEDGGRILELDLKRIENTRLVKISPELTIKCL